MKTVELEVDFQVYNQVREVDLDLTRPGQVYHQVWRQVRWQVDDQVYWRVFFQVYEDLL